MSKLDDLLAKKKIVVPLLDLSKSNIQSNDELKRIMEKLPDYKMRPIKVRSDEIKMKDKDFSFKMPRKEAQKLLKNNGDREAWYTYSDPIPNEMKDIVLIELCAVPIDWKMLTTLRPKNKQEEEYFGRLVEIGKFQLKTELRDRRELQQRNYIKKMKNKSGIIESRLVTCVECGEEMCFGKRCIDCNYDIYMRMEEKVVHPKPVSTSHKNKLNGRKKLGISSTKSKSKILLNGKP